VATDAGLTVPVVQGAQALDLSGFAGARRDIVERARTGKLARADLTGGTFTVSNLGMMGIDRFDAILNPPQVAILAMARRSSARSGTTATRRGDRSRR
jgi:pyruvate dehydrogenase E2 component (dihydrolipoamide acetyltransferase)